MDKDADVERAIDLERRRWAEVDEALSERTTALSEEQRQIRAALVEYFSILQQWAHEETARAAANHELINRDADSCPSLAQAEGKPRRNWPASRTIKNDR